MVAGEGGVDTGLGRPVRRRGGDGLHAGLLVIGDNCHRLIGGLRLGGCLLENLDFAVDAQAPVPSSPRSRGHAVPGSSASCAPSLPGDRVSCTPCLAPVWPSRRARLPGHAPAHGGPGAASSQLVRIAQLLGLAAGQRDQPCLGLGRDRGLLKRRIAGERRCRGSCGCGTIENK